jgi:PAS domain S-box-containing protein
VEQALEWVVKAVVLALVGGFSYLLKHAWQCRREHADCKEEVASVKREAERDRNRLKELEVKLKECTTIQVNEAGLIELWDNAAQSIFGHTNDAMLGKPVWMLLPVHKREALRVRILTAAKNKREIVNLIVESTAVHKTGREFDVHMLLNSWNTQEAGWHAAVELRRIVDPYVRDEGTHDPHPSPSSRRTAP